MPQSLPCPHCTQPIGLDLRNIGLGRVAFHGLCPACLQPYRFGARVRRVALASMLAFAAIGAVLAYAYGHCGACARLDATPEFAGVPVVAALAWLAGAVAAGVLGARLYVARCVRRGEVRPVLVAVDASDAGASVDNLRAQPGTAIAAAVVLLSLLLFMLADEWRAIAARLAAARMPLRTDRQLDAAAPGMDAVTFWFFVAIEIALTAIVLACLVALLRKTLRDRRTRGAPIALRPD